MKPFLESFTDYLLENHFDDLPDSCVVFPSRRAGVYFTKYFSSNSNKTTFLPGISTLNEFIFDLSDIQTADPLYLLFLLYDVFKKHTGIDESFDEFYFWGQVILSDFNDIDKELVDAKQLYSNLSHIKEIENRFNDWNEEQIKAIEQFWGVMDIKSDIPARSKFLSLWEKLFVVYSEFNKVLDCLKVGYDGRIYRCAVEKIEEGKIETITSNKIFIVGFNALSRSERKILKLLKAKIDVQFFWDYDEYYYKDNNHEAGYFLRLLVDQFPAPEKFTFDTGILNSKKINLYSAPTQVGQAKIIPEILHDISDNPEQFAIVLADETLLLPVLYSLPESVMSLNITMGFPVKQSPAMQMVDGLLLLQTNAKKSKNGKYFMVKDVFQIINQPYLKEFNCYGEILKELNENIRPVINAERLRKNELCELLFSDIESTENYCSYLIQILLKILENDKTDELKDHRKLVDKQVIYAIYRETLKLDEVLNEHKIKLSKNETFIKIYRQYLSNVNVSFRGEPLAGIQIMGILESRLLDFKNLTLLSVNEGTFPKNSVQLSLIPYNLRKGFGLLTQEHQDAIFSYHFYHMLQRTENLSLVYSTKQNDFGKSEISRYIHQIRFDERINISEFHISDKAGVNIIKPIIVKRNKRINDVLSKYLSGELKLSPTSLSSYINCKLKFYFRYLAGLKPSDEIPDDMNSRMFGRILHLALEILYESFKNKVVEKEDVGQLSKEMQLNLALDHAFNDVLAGGKQVEHNTGKLLINYQVLKNYLKRVLELDKVVAPFLLKGFEVPVQYSFKIILDGKSYDIGLDGYIDRLLEKEGTLIVQDFKTGNVETKSNSIEDLFKETEKKDFAAIRQVLIYSMAFKSDNVKPQILSVRKRLEEEGISIFIEKAKIKNISTIKDNFNEMCISAVEQLFTTAEFYQTEHEKNCEWCDYKQICRR